MQGIDRAPRARPNDGDVRPPAKRELATSHRLRSCFARVCSARWADLSRAGVRHPRASLRAIGDRYPRAFRVHLSCARDKRARWWPALESRTKTKGSASTQVPFCNATIISAKPFRRLSLRASYRETQNGSILHLPAGDFRCGHWRRHFPSVVDNGVYKNTGCILACFECLSKQRLLQCKRNDPKIIAGSSATESLYAYSLFCSTTD